jgi:hypothetical protein
MVEARNQKERNERNAEENTVGKLVYSFAVHHT